MASDHKEKKPGKCLPKKKIELKEKKAKNLRKSRNQNKPNSDEEVLHVSKNSGRILKEVKPKIFNYKLTKLKSEVREDEYSHIQVNLCQKLLFLHQLTHNMTSDCSLNYKFST